MHLYINAGSLNETEQEQGLAHFMEHMLFNGTKNFPPGEIVKYFQKIGMRFGPDANAYTGFNQTVYDILLPEGSDKSISEGLVVLKDYLCGALLLPAEIEKEKKIILSEKNMRDSDTYRTFVEAIKFEMPDSLISRRLPIGDENVIKKTDKKLLKRFYDAWYAPQNSIIIIVGDFDKNIVEKKLQELFSQIKPRAPFRALPDIGDINHRELKAFYHYEKKAGKTNVSIETIRKIPSPKDSLVLRKEELLKKAADMIIEKRIDEMINSGKAPFISASIDSGIYFKNVEYASIEATPSAGKWKETLSEIEKILRKAFLYGFSEEEIDIVKKELKAFFENAVKQEQNIESSDLANKIIYSISNNRVYNSIKQKKTIADPIIFGMTAQQVYETFLNNWKDDGILLLVTGDTLVNSTDNDNPEEIIKDVYYQSLEIPVEEPEKKDEVLFPYLEPPVQPGKIVKQTDIKDLGIIHVDFENGVRLNLKKTDFDDNKILFSASFGGGKSVEPDSLPGISAIAFDVINESGTGEFTNNQLSEALAGKHTSIGFGIDEGCFIYSGTSVPEETELLFQLLYTFLKDVGYRENAYKRALEDIRQEHEALTHNIEGGKALYLEKFLAGGDTRFGFPSYEDIKKISLEDIKAWLEPIIRNNAIEISITGDFNIDWVINNASLYLGGLPARKIKKEKKLLKPPEFPIGAKKIFEIETDIPKAIVTAAYPTDDFYDIKRTRVLNLLSALFSEKMRDEIREKKGLAYASYAFNNPSETYKNYGVLRAEIFIKTGDEKKTVAAVKKIVSDLAAGRITKDEFIRVKKPILTTIKDLLEKNSYWLNTVLSNSVNHPEQLDWARNIYSEYSKITLKDIKKAARTYLDNKKAAFVIIKQKK
jgi:zinc protease